MGWLKLGTASGSSGFSRKSMGVAFMCATGAVLSVLGFIDLRTSQRLAAEGVRTSARVVGMHTKKTRHSTRHYLQVEYRTSDGEVVKAADRVSADRYRRATVGEAVTVNYLPNDPEV